MTDIDSLKPPQTLQVGITLSHRGLPVATTPKLLRVRGEGVSAIFEWSDGTASSRPVVQMAQEMERIGNGGGSKPSDH